MLEVASQKQHKIVFKPHNNSTVTEDRLSVLHTQASRGRPATPPL